MSRKRSKKQNNNAMKVKSDESTLQKSQSKISSTPTESVVEPVRSEDIEEINNIIDINKQKDIIVNNQELIQNDTKELPNNDTTKEDNEQEDPQKSIENVKNGDSQVIETENYKKEERNISSFHSSHSQSFYDANSNNEENQEKRTEHVSMQKKESLISNQSKNEDEKKAPSIEKIHSNQEVEENDNKNQSYSLSFRNMKSSSCEDISQLGLKKTEYKIANYAERYTENVNKEKEVKRGMSVEFIKELEELNLKGRNHEIRKSFENLANMNKTDANNNVKTNITKNTYGSNNYKGNNKQGLYTLPKNSISNENESHSNHVFIEKIEIDQGDEGDKVSKEVNHLEKAIEEQEKEKEKGRQKKEKQDKKENTNEEEEVVIQKKHSEESRIIENANSREMVIHINKQPTVDTHSTSLNYDETNHKNNSTMSYPKEVVDIKIYDDSEVEDIKYNELESFWNKDGAPSLLDNIDADDNNQDAIVGNYETNQKENSYLASSNRSQSTSQLSSSDYMIDREEEKQTQNVKSTGKSKSLTEFLLSPNEEFLVSKKEIKDSLLQSESHIHTIKNGILNPDEELEQHEGRDEEREEEEEEENIDIVNKINLIRAKLALNNNVDIDNMPFEHFDIYQLNFDSLGLNVDNLTKEEKYILLLYMSDKRLESVWNEREAFKRAHDNVKNLQMNQSKKRESHQGEVRRVDSLEGTTTTSKQLLNQTMDCSSSNFKSERHGSEQERNMESVYKGESPANKRRYVQNLKSFQSNIQSGTNQDTNQILEKEYLGTDPIIYGPEESEMQNRLKRVQSLHSYVSKGKYHTVSNMSLSSPNDLLDYILQHHEMDEVLYNQEKFFRFYEKMLMKYKLTNHVNQGKNEKHMMEMFLKGCIYLFFQDNDYIEQFLKFYEQSQKKRGERKKEHTKEENDTTESSDEEVDKNIFNNIHFSKYFYEHVCSLNKEEASHFQNDSAGQLNLFNIMDEMIGSIMKDETLIMKIRQMQLINTIMKKEVNISAIKVAGTDVYLDVQPHFMEPVNDMVLGKNIGFFNIQVIQEKYSYNYYRHQEELHILEMNRNNSIWYNMVNYFNGWFGITQENEETHDAIAKKSTSRRLRSSKRLSRDFMKNKKGEQQEKKNIIREEQKEEHIVEPTEEQKEEPIEELQTEESQEKQQEEQIGEQVEEQREKEEAQTEEPHEEQTEEQECLEKQTFNANESNIEDIESNVVEEKEKKEENNNDLNKDVQNLENTEHAKNVLEKSKSLKIQRRKSKLESNLTKDSKASKTSNTKSIERAKTYFGKEVRISEENQVLPRKTKTTRIEFNDDHSKQELKSEERKIENDSIANLEQENQPQEEEESDKGQVHFKKNKNEHMSHRVKYQNNTSAQIISFQYKGNLPQIDINNLNLHKTHLNKEKKMELIGNYITTYFNERVRATSLKDTDIKDYTDAHFILEKCYKYNDNINKSYVHLLNFHTKKYLAVDIKNGKIAFTKKYNDTYYVDNKKVKHPITTYFQLDSISDMMKNILIEEIIKSVVNIMLH